MRMGGFYLNFALSRLSMSAEKNFLVFVRFGSVCVLWSVFVFGCCFGLCLCLVWRTFYVVWREVVTWLA